VEDTRDQTTNVSTPREGRPLPGVAVVFVAGKPSFDARELPTGGLVIGREGDLALDDPRLSRRHLEVARADGRWTVRDLDSRNGSFSDGIPVQPETAVPAGPLGVLRLGDSIVLALDDVRPILGGAIERTGGTVLGPRLRKLYADLERTARTAQHVHVTGETGSGKELVARRFHDAGGSAGAGRPFVAVNCAGIPAGVADRLLFGTRRGAYSGADADAPGYLQAADGGTLFLDEIAELSLEVQAKLLRVLEMHEVLPLGASRPVPVKLRVISATHHDLRARVDAGLFREDLFYRLGIPTLQLPPLRQRPEEMPWLIAQALAAPRLSPHVTLIEAALLRTWPGNVRELLAEVTDATRRAGAEPGSRVEARHLGERAGLGRATAATAAPAATPARTASAAEASPAPALEMTRDRVEAALHKAAGNVSQAARDLGLHRTQLRRLLELHAVDPKLFRGD